MYLGLGDSVYPTLDMVLAVRFSFLQPFFSRNKVTRPCVTERYRNIPWHCRASPFSRFTLYRGTEAPFSFAESSLWRVCTLCSVRDATQPGAAIKTTRLGCIPIHAPSERHAAAQALGWTWLEHSSRADLTPTIEMTVWFGQFLQHKRRLKVSSC